MAVDCRSDLSRHHSQRSPSVGRDFSRQHGRIIALVRWCTNRHDRGADRVLQRVPVAGWNTSVSPDVAGSDYRRYRRHTPGSVALIGFGPISIIEVASSCVLLWWLAEAPIDRDRAAHRLSGPAFLRLPPTSAIDASADC